MGIDHYLRLLLDFIELQVPKDGPALVSVFIWAAIFEPTKRWISNRFPLTPLVMIGIGYACLIAVFSLTDRLQSHYGPNSAVPNLVIVLALWLIVSGFVGALIEVRQVTSPLWG